MNTSDRPRFLLWLSFQTVHCEVFSSVSSRPKEERWNRHSGYRSSFSALSQKKFRSESEYSLGATLRMAVDDNELPPVGKRKAPAKKKRVLAEGDLMKAVIRSGEETGSPTDGDLVILHYTILLQEGGVVESSRPEHGGSAIPLKLVLGKSKMIAAWEEALPSMTKGEIARFKVRPHLHYGDPECPVPVQENFPKSSELLFDIEILDFFKVKVVTEDFGVLKKVLQDGVGWETPREPYEVSLRIVGSVPGSEKPFIVRREEPLYFTMGKQEVPAGLEKGIETMTKNERAIIYVSGSYITESSAMPELPMKAAEVQFEVEVLQVFQVRDMLGNGSVIKRRIRDGKGEFPVDCPLQDSTLLIHYKGMLPNEKDKVFIDTRRENTCGEPLEFSSGEGMVPEGLEMCVRLMLPGEISIIHSTSTYAYDKFARPALVPEGASVKWEVELISFEKRKDWTGFTFKEIMDDSEKQKSTGNRLFKEAKFELAKAKYDFILREFKHVNPNGDQEVAELGRAQIALQLNVAACYHKLGEYTKSIETCDKVLEGNPHHVKALYRRGLAYTATADFEEARNDFQQMIVLDKSSESDANAALMKLKKKEQEAAVQARKQFKGLFDRNPGLLSQPAEAESQPEASPAAFKGQKRGEIEEADDNGQDLGTEEFDDKGQDSEIEDDPFAKSRRTKKSTGYWRVILNRFSQGRCSIL